MDDVLVHDSNEENHLKYLKIIFEKIRKGGLKLKLSKCALMKCPLQYLGHLISDEEINPSKENVVSLVNLALPFSTETRHIIGLDSYYRMFIANLSNTLGSLTELKKKINQASQ